jgi:decaprenylphospho-beta-D-erythro-pentofuranosid-2-ulose 2-reductase
MRRLVIFGANSGIAEAFARRAIEQGDALFLVGRTAHKLEALKQDLHVRGATHVAIEIADLDDYSVHEGVFQRAKENLGDIDGILIAHGVLGDEVAAQLSFEVAEKIIHTNFLSVMSLCTLFAREFEAKRKGFIAVISSVAGDRGRQSNYIYGASKGGLTIFLQGLRNRLSRSGVQVLTVKPGFVDTPMTASLKKGFLWASPDSVARGIDRAIWKGKDVAYLPSFWWGVMVIIKTIPESVFKRLKL